MFQILFTCYFCFNFNFTEYINVFNTVVFMVRKVKNPLPPRLLVFDLFPKHPYYSTPLPHLLVTLEYRGIWAKKEVQMSYVSQQWRMMYVKFEEELSRASKNDIRNFEEFWLNTQSLNICTLMDTIWPKYIMFELKKYWRVMCHVTEGCDAIFIK